MRLHPRHLLPAALLLTGMLSACDPAADPGPSSIPPANGSSYRFIGYGKYDAAAKKFNDSDAFAITVAGQNSTRYGRGGVTNFVTPGFIGVDGTDTNGYVYTAGGDFLMPWKWGHNIGGLTFSTGWLWDTLGIQTRTPLRTVFAIDTTIYSIDSLQGPIGAPMRYQLSRTISYFKPDNVTVGMEVLPVEVFVVRTEETITGYETGHRLNLDTICYAPKIKFIAAITFSRVSASSGEASYGMDMLQSYTLK